MKTAKQKCLEMWEWFTENPGKNKDDYFVYCKLLEKEDDFHNCWACAVEDELRLKKDPIDFLRSTCKYCPIDWPNKDNPLITGFYCIESGSPYFIWSHYRNILEYKFPGKFKPKQQQKAAKAMVKLIKDTWKETNK